MDLKAIKVKEGIKEKEDQKASKVTLVQSVLKAFKASKVPKAM